MTVALDYDDYLAHYGVKGMKWGVRKDRGSSSSKPSKRAKVTYKERKSYEYQKKGLSKEEADAKAAKAAKVAKARKAVLILGGVAMVAAAGYVAGDRLAKDYVGVNLKSGAMLQNVNNIGGSKPQKEGMLYVTFKNHDNKQYRSRFASEVFIRDRSKDVFSTKLSAIEPIKAPSNKKAEKLYEEYKRKVRGSDLYAPENYKAFNKDLNYVGKEKDKKAFTDFMKSKGYNAIIDLYDQRPLYGAKKPTILLDSTKTATTVGHEKLSEFMSDKGTSRMSSKKAYLKGAKVALALGSFGVAPFEVNEALKKRSMNKQVDQYFNDHPNTEMSPTEVYMMIAKDRKRGGDNAA